MALNKCMYCLDCKLEKNIEDFGRNKRRKTGRQSYCLPCMKARTRASYHKHKKAYFERALKRNKETNILINTVKDVPCKDCGVRYPPYVMDFDHMGKSKKLLKISTMRRKRMAFDKIIAEMEKCEVVCSNCHRERTNSRMPARY